MSDLMDHIDAEIGRRALNKMMDNYDAIMHVYEQYKPTSYVVCPRCEAETPLTDSACQSCGELF